MEHYHPDHQRSQVSYRLHKLTIPDWMVTLMTPEITVYVNIFCVVYTKSWIFPLTRNGPYQPLPNWYGHQSIT